MRRILCSLGGATLIALVAILGGAATGRAATTPTFGHAVVVDHQRVTGEPSLAISPTQNTDGYRDVYVSAPYGFSTTASFVWRSGDGGKTFHLIGDEFPPIGKPALSCIGGGDSSLATDRSGNLYFADLQGLTNVSDSVSVDSGNTFTTTCNSANGGVVDRPWLSVYGNPLSDGREYMTVDQVDQCDPEHCSLAQVGNNMLELTQTSGINALSQVFAPLPTQQIEPDGIVGGTVVDERNGDLYIVHTGYTEARGKILGGNDANGNTNAIVVDRFPGGYSATTPTPIPSGHVSLCKPYNVTGPCVSETVVHSPLNLAQNSTVNNGQDFATMAIDRRGNLYVVWAQSPVDASGNVDGPTTIYLSTSTNQGATWSKPVNVSSHVSGLRTNVFPWIEAGNSGRIDIVWYGTPALGACPGEPCGAGFVNGSYNVYMAQSLNAVVNGKPNTAPTFATTRVSEYPVHYGEVCEFGLACTTGGDRGLLDFIQVQADPSTGAAEVVYADGANDDFNGGETSAWISYARQTSGPGLFGGTLSGTVPTGSAPGSPDAFYAANGTLTPASGNMRLVSSSMTRGTSSYTVTMRVKSLSSLAPDPKLGGSDLVWLTRWELKSAHPTTASQGHVYYAAMESNAGGTPTFYAGDSVCGIASTHCKFITYPPQHTITGSYTAAGTITLRVPFADVPGSGELYSVTGVTATQAHPSSTGTSLFNVIDSTQPYDVP